MNTQFLTKPAPSDTQITFFKCVRWQVEETLDPIHCPYHYFCDSHYPGDYPPYVDNLVLVFTSASYLATLVLMVVDVSSRRLGHDHHQPRRWLLPSGPVLLPVILLILAKGHRVNAVFPLSSFAPAILQMVQVSALAFGNGSGRKHARYWFFETSALVSGILHASLYLDSVVMPYYTGFDALVSSEFSGECPSCVCRGEALVVGGKLVKYRGWSATTFLVVAALCLRITCRTMSTTTGQKKCRVIFVVVKPLVEILGWVSVTMDCVYLIRKNPPQENMLMRGATFGGILVLICLYLIKKVIAHIRKPPSRSNQLIEFEASRSSFSNKTDVI